jgi:hypothetical protein
MASNREANDRSVSTTIGWEPVTITERPAGQGDVRRRRSTRPFLPKRDWRKPLTLTVAWRGNPGGRIEVKARGRTWNVYGHDAMLDVLVAIWEADEAAARRHGQDSDG